MATKVFISQPMRGKTDQEIIGEREHAKDFLTGLLKEPIEFIDSNFNTYIQLKTDKSERTNAMLLAKALVAMATSDIVFFCRGWRETRGCLIEHEVARRYGMTIIEE